MKTYQSWPWMMVSVMALAVMALPHNARAGAQLSSTPTPVVTAYPNPWRADQARESVLRFGGFTGRGTVKIYTISGEEVRSLSGTAPLAWDLRNGSGESVASGVYLYLATPEGGQTYHGKLAVIK